MSFRRGLLFVPAMLVLSSILCSGAGAEQYRAFWADTWNADISSTAAIDAIVSNIRLANSNAVMVQVRRRGDAFFPSPLEPWCAAASSSFDSLEYLIKKCHAQTPRIDIYAYMVTFPVNTSSSPSHPSNLYPQYFTKNSSGVAQTDNFDPGHPDALKYIADVYMDVVNRYDVDGIHYDYVRFLGSNLGYNDQSVARYNASGDTNFSQWRRDQVTQFVRQVYARTLAAQPGRAAKGFKPWVNVSGSTIPWGNGPTTESDWLNTSAYSDVFQDWRAWMEEGILDLNMPMNYDREYNSAQAIYYDNWIEFEKNHKYNRHVTPGPGIYMNYIQDSVSMIRQALAPSALGRYADGVAQYSYSETNGVDTTDVPVPAKKPNSDYYNAVSNPNAPYNVYNGGNPPFPDKTVTPHLTWKENPTTANLMGCVTQQSGSQSIWADLATVSISGPANRSMRVDGNGLYAFIDVPAGTYSVTATKSGVGSQTKTVVTSNGQIPATNFHLGGADTTAPALSGVGVIANGSGAPILTDSKAIIVWNTDEPADSRVEYGLTASYGSTTILDPMLSDSRTWYLSAPRGHIVALCALTPNTTYHYRAISRDSSGNQSVSGDLTFTTLATDATLPGISNIVISGVTGTGATITWTTTEAATTRVEYGTSPSYGSTTTLDSTKVISHTANLAGLQANRLYHFRVRSADNSGNEAIAWDMTFTTAGTTDITPPVISNVIASNITTEAVTITWTTDELSSSQIDYGSSASYGASSVLYPTGVISHSVTVNGLAQGTLYHYRVRSVDASNNVANSGDFTFTTTIPDTTPPVITGVSATSITQNTATIIWTTNEAATSQVDYGLTTSYGSSTTLDTNLLTSHSVLVTPLAPSTPYHFRVRSKDAANNERVTGDYSFSTIAPDTTPPVISSVAAGNIVADGAGITWSTNEAATSQVEYGTTTSYGLSTTLDATLVTSHSMPLAGLTADTLYHFCAKSKDVSNNLATSPDYTFRTVLPQYGEIIIDNTDPGFSLVLGSSTDWATGTSSTDKYGSDYRFYNAATPTVGSDGIRTGVAKWFPNIPVSGKWKVYAWWPQGGNRPTNTPYRIYYQGGSVTVRVSQQANGGKWNQLGTVSYPMAPGTSNYVTVSNDADPSGKVPMADAVRFVPDTQTFTSPASFVQLGWNLFSLPALPQNPDPVAVLTGIDVPNSSLQYWKNDTPDGGYQSYGSGWGWTGPLTVSIPYWLCDPVGSKTLSFVGLERVADARITIPAHAIAPYWVMIGQPFNHNTNCAGIKFNTLSNPTPITWTAAYNAGIIESAAMCFKNQGFVSTGPSDFMVQSNVFEPWYGYWMMLRSTEPVTITIPVAP